MTDDPTKTTIPVRIEVELTDNGSEYETIRYTARVVAYTDDDETASLTQPTPGHADPDLAVREALEKWAWR